MGFFDTFKRHMIFRFYSLIELSKNGLGLRRMCRSNTRLDDKVVVITGANTGIGKETALQLSLRGAKIISGCRDVEKGQKAAQDIKQKCPGANICVLKLDLSSLKSVRLFVKSVEEIESKIDILINNAGVMACPETQTEDGFELQFGTNHLAHFLLTLSLLPLLKKSPKARIITVSSLVHIIGCIHFENINLRNNAYSPRKAYSQSKLANVLFSRELAKRLGHQSNVKVYCLHPGIIRSDLWRHNTSLFLKIFAKIFFISVGLGAQTTLFCALEESIEGESGYYYENCKRVDHKCMVSNATNDNDAQLLWNLSSDLVQLEDNLKL